jgi:hypothetical protein
MLTDNWYDSVTCVICVLLHIEAKLLNEFRPNQTMWRTHHSYVVLFFQAECQLTPACAVCRTSRTTTTMIPGTNICPSDWTMEYSGHIMAGYTDHTAPSEYICVDSSTGYYPSNSNNDNQNVLYYTVSNCGALPCPPYSDNVIVTCIVCSK